MKGADYFRALFLVLVAPRVTIKRLNEANHSGAALVLAALGTGGLSASYFMVFPTLAAGPTLLLQYVIGPIFGLGFNFLTASLISKFGLREKARLDQIRMALAWSGVVWIYGSVLMGVIAAFDFPISLSDAVTLWLGALVLNMALASTCLSEILGLTAGAVFWRVLPAFMISMFFWFLGMEGYIQVYGISV